MYISNFCGSQKLLRVLNPKNTSLSILDVTYYGQKTRTFLICVHDWENKDTNGLIFFVLVIHIFFIRHFCMKHSLLNKWFNPLRYVSHNKSHFSYLMFCTLILKFSESFFCYKPDHTNDTFYSS